MSGYTIEQFLSDYLVPMEFFACRRPRDPKRAKELKREVRELNNRFTGASRAFDANESNDPLDLLKKENLPVETICRVRLDKAFRSGTSRELFDFNRDVVVEVWFTGGLVFPPEAKCSSEAIARQQPALALALERESHDQRWQLVIHALVRIERGSVRSKEKLDHKQHLLVKCTQFKVESRVDKEGDVLVDSWLPIEDITQELEAMLDLKLQVAVSGMRL